jgi:inhibitor of KinA sporulation pathway (predicted exonuclease)
MEDTDKIINEKLQLLTIEANDKNTLECSSIKNVISNDAEKFYDEFRKATGLRKMREFCIKYNIIFSQKLTFKELESHVGKMYASQFNVIQQERQLKRKTFDCQKPQPPPFDYYIIIDFECTCWADNTKKVQEIIEFPAVLVDANQKVIVDCFREYVKPKLHPELSEFCVDFTGISQETVDNAKSLPTVIVLFRQWLAKNDLKDPSKYLIVTDGKEDIRRFLNLGLLINNLPFPHELRSFADVKVLFKKYHRKYATLAGMMKHYELEFEGRKHCGLDDAKNIARLVVTMSSQKVKIIPTNRMVPAHYCEEYEATSVISTPPIPTLRTCFYFSRVSRNQYTSKFYITCDECVAGDCEAARFYC